MDINLMNTARGLIPMDDYDGEKKRHLKIGEVYQAKIKLFRNYEFHKKYFALFRCAWEYLNERVQAHYKDDIEQFRVAVQIAAGHCKLSYSIKRQEWIEDSLSVSFETMSEDEFRDLYIRVYNVIFATFLAGISEEEFKANLIKF